MCLHASSSLCRACRRWLPGALRPYVRWIDCVVIARAGYLPLCWDSFLSLGDARARTRARTRSAIILLGNTSGPAPGWEPQGHSLCLEYPGAQFMFGSCRGPVAVREFQGPSLCLGKPGAQLMFAKSRGPVYTRSHVIFGTAVDQLVLGFQRTS